VDDDGGDEEEEEDVKSVSVLLNKLDEMGCRNLPAEIAKFGNEISFIL
jgi:hypothetical protein